MAAVQVAAETDPVGIQVVALAAGHTHCVGVDGSECCHEVKVCLRDNHCPLDIVAADYSSGSVADAEVGPVMRIVGEEQNLGQDASIWDFPDSNLSDHCHS